MDGFKRIYRINNSERFKTEDIIAIKKTFANCFSSKGLFVVYGYAVNL